MKKPVIAVFDVGKTNKKLFLFDEHYKIVFERSARFLETVDEDGFPCDNLESLRLSIFDSLHEVFRKQEFEIKAINFSTYGASFVYIDENGRPLTPLYNYLKPYPDKLKKNFYSRYGGEENFSFHTASPILGSLNSGMQLYRLKEEHPDIFKKVNYALHLPQYMSFLISGKAYSDITSIGCHTGLWDFAKNDYHEWVGREGILPKLAPIAPSDKTVAATFPGNNYGVGIGLHDSSAALIPYLKSFQKPFILISTGTWCISFNSFTDSPLTVEELKEDCLSYLQYQGIPVKASRFFGGNIHEVKGKEIADHFHQPVSKQRNMAYQPTVLSEANKLENLPFSSRDLSTFSSDMEAYHFLMLEIIMQQKRSTSLILDNSEVKRIFVDGGFSKNVIYMNLLAEMFPDMEVFAASMAQATALGTALAIHDSWNKKPIPKDLIELKFYSINDL